MDTAQPTVWALATGIADVAAGLAIIFLIQARLAARLLTVMFASYSACIWIPALLRNSTQHDAWAGNAMNFALVSAAWVVADALAARATGCRGECLRNDEIAGVGGLALVLCRICRGHLRAAPPDRGSWPTDRIGQSFQLPSHVLGDTRVVNVYLPESYESWLRFVPCPVPARTAASVRTSYTSPRWRRSMPPTDRGRS